MISVIPSGKTETLLWAAAGCRRGGSCQEATSGRGKYPHAGKGNDRGAGSCCMVLLGAYGAVAAEPAARCVQGWAGPGAKAEAGMGHPILSTCSILSRPAGHCGAVREAGTAPLAVGKYAGAEGCSSCCGVCRDSTAQGYAKVEMDPCRVTGADTGCSGAGFCMHRTAQDARGRAGMPPQMRSFTGVVRGASGCAGVPVGKVGVIPSAQGR